MRRHRHAVRASCAAEPRHPKELALTTGDFSATPRHAGLLDARLVLPLLRAMGRRARGDDSRSSLRAIPHAFEPGAGVSDLPGWEFNTVPEPHAGPYLVLRTSDRVLISGDAVVPVKLNSPSGLLLPRQGLSGRRAWYTTWS